MHEQTVNISEVFYSIQGEGVTAGIPAVFFRLQGCNLLCGGPNGKWVREGRATWHCDTEQVWRTGTPMSVESLYEEWLVPFPPPVRFVFTGGEPLMNANYLAIDNLFRYARQRGYPFKGRTEVETNGTVVRDVTELLRFGQINCSPKLGNSGIKMQHRCVPAAIKAIKQHPNHWWKFVVSDEGDIDEIESTWIRPFELRRDRVILMPACTFEAFLPSASAVVAQLAKDHKLRMCTRLQVLCWDQTTGV